MTWLDRPLLALDTETTGVDPWTARPLSACLGYSDSPGRWEPITTYLMPDDFDIPEASVKVHGLSVDRLTALGASTDRAEVLDGILAALIDCTVTDTPIVGHNLRYDLTLLDAEFGRYGLGQVPRDLLCLDTLILFRRLYYQTGSRQLGSLAERHGITFPTHDAEADSLASLRLLHIVANVDELMPHVDPRTLHELQAHWYDTDQKARSEKAFAENRDWTPAFGWPIAVEAVA